MIFKFLARLHDEMNDIRFAASSLAFSTLLSIIPFMVIVLAVFQYVGGLDQLYPKMEGVLLNYMKEATGPTVTRFIRKSLQNVKPSTLGISGGLFLMFASLGLIRNMDFAFNKLWKLKINKPVYKRMWLHWMVLLAAPLTLAIFTGLKSTSFFSQAPQNWDHQFLFLFWICLLLFALYKIMPDTKVHTWPALISAALAGIMLALVQSSFLWISVKVFKNNTIYGSLASFPIFLIWLLTVWYVVLTGVAFCAFLQQKVFR
ncbi:YihY/virulence factor BrkB family protein [Pseudobdellovibrio exovorus]|uniref:Ribonuclease BN n=1 Tax=Pseudobdellovibrio exovorus JSS TaxID=1184267 RepID=M4VS97_9BACT|nr:YihY/virulence factor BrkB family protein [Pseudobdellovibrio exovorus]AGH96064.1 ribonuclease BN [Pseudobdellovibrio exovorus JSS]